MKIVRAIWGKSEQVFKEIPKKPQWKDETVFVWGSDNYRKLKNRGYDCVLVRKEITDPLYSNFLEHFTHKLLCLQLADQLYDEYLFLDWDVQIVKTIDAKFWDLVKSKQIQCPVYGYPDHYAEKCRTYIDEKEPNTWKWVDKHDENLINYSWKYLNYHIVPNFCFYYSYKGRLASKLLEIKHADNVITCIEEFCMYIYAASSLDDYLTKYEPFVIRGREDNCRHFNMENDDTMKKVNEYVASKIQKEIYLIHE